MSCVDVYCMVFTSVGMFHTDCPVGRYSVDCKNECHCKNTTEQCSQELGLCQSGCDYHWTGIGCQGWLYFKYINIVSVVCLSGG